jgi:DNA mismatch endonuclease (patch repair protein)
MGMTRSENMSRIRSKNTRPEMTIRKLIWSMGYRYRLHRKDLPGKPDLVFSGRHKVLFVHGCFWHAHTCKEGIRNPKSNQGYWLAKRQHNIERDKIAVNELEKAGWDVMVIWECELNDLNLLKERIICFLNS